MKYKTLIAVFALTTFLCPYHALAWGSRGHALVAEVAYHYLSESTKAKVKAYLGDMTIEDSANWMDAIKKDHANDYMKPYHYIDIEKGGKEAPVGDNLVTILNITLKDLDHKETLSPEEIKRHILFLFHLIGDLHQPLHVGYPDDKGGNSVKISFLGAHQSNLHAVWDTEILEYKGTTLPDVLKMNTYTPQQLEAVKKIDVIGWAKQTRGYVKNAYKIQDDKINDIYVDANYPIIKSQILDAGIRLAAVLERYFGDGR